MQTQDRTRSAALAVREAPNPPSPPMPARAEPSPTPPAPAPSVSPTAHAGMVLKEDMITMPLAAVQHVMDLLQQGDKYGALAFMQDGLAGAMSQAAEPQEYPKYVYKPTDPNISAIAENEDHEAEINKGWGIRDAKGKAS
jgi:hypothetical protein